MYTGWTIWGGYGTLLLKPCFLVASDRSQVARRRVRLDLGDLGIIEQQLNQSSNQLCPVLPSCDVSASDWSIPRTLDRFLLPTIRPCFQEQRTTGIPNRPPFILQCMEDGLFALKRLASTVPCTSASVGRASSPPHHSTI